MNQTFLAFVSLLLLSQALSEPSFAKESENCNKAYSAIGNSDLSLFLHAERVLQRELTKKEREALAAAKKIAKDFEYTPAEVTAQNRLLKKAGYSKEEMDLLRQGSVLRNKQLADEASTLPLRAEVVELNLTKVDRKTLAVISEGKPVNYVVDSNGEIYLVPSSANLSEGTLWLVRNSDSPDELHMIREAGTLQHQGKSGYLFRPAFSLDSTSKEVEEQLAKFEGSADGAKAIRRQALASEEQQKVLSCMDLLTNRNSMKSAVFDRMLADNLVLTSAIATSELAGANRFGTSDGRQVVLADIIGANVNSILGGMLGKHLVSRNAGFVTSMATRTAMAMGMIEVQKQIYQQVLENKAEERSETIANFDRLYFFARLPVAHYTDKFIMKQLPELLFDACKRDSKITLVITPRSVRIVERFASTFLYYGVRSAIIQE